MRTILATIFLTGALATTALCDEGDFQWQGQLAPGQLMSIEGIHGAIRVGGTSDGTASVTARKTGNISDPRMVSVQVAQYEGGVVICAIYPDTDPEKPKNTCGARNTYLTAGDNDVQVEFTVKAPLGVRLSAHTLDGDIEATSLTADVDAATGHGGITISTTGSAQATTRKGSISASIGSVSWSGVRFFDTGDGDVNLQRPADANVSVRASAFSGTVTSDFPLMTRTVPSSTFAYGTVGTDGRSLLLSTLHGTIMLRQGASANQ